MAAKTPAKTPTKTTEPQAKSQSTPKQSTPKPDDQSDSPENPPGSAGVPLPSDPSAVRLQQEQDDLQQPGRVAKAVADQVDNDPGYSKDQLAHMAEYWAHDEDE